MSYAPSSLPRGPRWARAAAVALSAILSWSIFPFAGSDGAGAAPVKRQATKGRKSTAKKPAPTKPAPSPRKPVETPAATTPTVPAPTPATAASESTEEPAAPNEIDTGAGNPETESGSPDDAAKYTLRYKFQPGETIRWRVSHTGYTKTTHGETILEADSSSTSIKVWQVKQVGEDGSASFVASVESVKMRQKMGDREESVFDSDSNEAPLDIFEQVAKNVGTPLAEITLDTLGGIVSRKESPEQIEQGRQGMLTIPLPKEEVAVGGEWNFEFDARVKARDGAKKKIKTRQRLTLRAVENGIAKIDLKSAILTPIEDPVIEAQLVQTETDAELEFDIERGRIVRQSSNVDREIVGAGGVNTMVHYKTTFSEELLADESTANSDSVETKTTR